MKINNEYVEIKLGNKTFVKQNMILNTYIDRIFNMQINTDYDDFFLTYCYLKFDEPLEVDYDSYLTRDNFDVGFWSEYSRHNFIGNSNNIKFFWKFGNTRTIINSLDDFVGKKITGIGFGDYYRCYAYLNTNNMNIILNQNEKIMINRVDNFISDGILNGLDYPLHLINNVADRDPKQITINEEHFRETTRAQLYSVGFGNKEGLMSEEYLVNEIQTEVGNNYITFNVEEEKTNMIFPNVDIFPTATLFPVKENQYIIFKYRLYRRYKDSNEQYVVTYLDQYYTMAIKNENFGNLEIKLKIERSEN